MSGTGKSIYAQLENSEIDEIINDVRSGEWQKVRCVFCGKKIDVLFADYSTGDPACKNGCDNG